MPLSSEIVAIIEQAGWRVFKFACQDGACLLSVDQGNSDSRKAHYFNYQTVDQITPALKGWLTRIGIV